MQIMNRIFLILLFIYSIFAFDSIAQITGSITGKITDSRTDNPLANANLVIIGLGMGASSDLDGEFTIDNIPPGSYNLRASFLGYETKDISDIVVNSARPTYLDITLNPSTISGEDVTVYAGYFWKEMESPPSVTTFSSEEIRRFPGGFQDVVRAISTVPGIAVVNSGGRNDLLVRGGGPSENLYVINGMEVPNINHFGTQGSSSGSLSFVNLDLVDNVDFSAGGFGVEYGDKLSSVMSLTMRPARSDRFGGKATISATQYGIDLEGPLNDKGGIIFSARKSYLDLIFKAAGLPFVPVYTDFNFIANYDITPRDQLFFLGLAAIDRVDRDLGSEENRVTNAGLLDNSQDQIISGITYRHLRRNGYRDLTLNFNSNKFSFSQLDENEVEYYNSDATERELVLKYDSKIILNKRTDFFYGLSFKSAWINNNTQFADSVYDRSGNKLPAGELGLPQSLNVDLNTGKYAAFVQFQRQFGLRTKVTFGVRGDYYDYIEDKFYPSLRASMDYMLTTKMTFKTSIGNYYQAPSYVWISNPDNRSLKALRSDMGVFGLDYLLREDISLGGEVYYKKYSDLPTGATPESSYLVLSNSGVGYGGREDDFQSFGYLPLKSEGKGNAYGLEISLTKKYSKSCCYGQAALSIGRSEYTAANGITYPGIFDQRVIFSLSGGLKPNPKWEFSMRFRFYTGAPYTPVYLPSENNGEIVSLPDEYLEERLKPGHHLDIRVDRKFNLPNLTIIVFVDIQNVYNYNLPRIPQYDFWTDEINDSDSIAILPSIGISAEF